MACKGSPTLTDASGMPSEPPDADPHVRWCGGRRGEPGAYPIDPPRCLIELDRLRKRLKRPVPASRQLKAANVADTVVRRPAAPRLGDRQRRLTRSTHHATSSKGVLPLAVVSA